MWSPRLSLLFGAPFVIFQGSRKAVLRTPILLIQRSINRLLEHGPRSPKTTTNLVGNPPATSLTPDIEASALTYSNMSYPSTQLGGRRTFVVPQSLRLVF